MKLTPEDLPRRRPVWEAMSELFLDTELDAGDKHRIARALAESGYTAAELEVILRDELSPVLSANLEHAAGEWSGFDMKEVENQILAKPPQTARGRWGQSRGGRIVREAWAEIMQALTSLGVK